MSKAYRQVSIKDVLGEHEIPPKVAFLGRKSAIPDGPLWRPEEITRQLQQTTLMILTASDFLDQMLPLGHMGIILRAESWEDVRSGDPVVIVGSLEGLTDLYRCVVESCLRYIDGWRLSAADPQPLFNVPKDLVRCRFCHYYQFVSEPHIEIHEDLGGGVCCQGCYDSLKAIGCLPLGGVEIE